ncbi:MAG: hypothetical protein ACW98J_08955 [Candidatus Thorarchaeota archaeon]|jgi:uncharacterized membrane protein YidH (DUF202 family)
MNDKTSLRLNGNGHDLSTTLAVIRTIEAEKRTHLAELRTGIGILTIPMSLLTILIATSNYYSLQEVFGFIVGLVFGIICLAIIGGYLVAHAFGRIRSNKKLKQETCPDTMDLLHEHGYGDL